MRTVRRIFHRDIVAACAFVAVAFLALFFFIDVVEELGEIGKGRSTFLHVVVWAALRVPSRFYELAPIAVLIGCIFALARLAQSSQFTILRTSGLGPGRALLLLGELAFAFSLLTFAVGDYVVPASERLAGRVKAAASGSGLELARGGAWLRETVRTPEGERHHSIHIGSADGGTLLRDVRIFEFDADGRLLARLRAARAEIRGDGTWRLADVAVTRWADAANAVAEVTRETRETLAWPSTLTPEVVWAAVMPITSMSTADLWRTIAHKSENEQAVQAEEIQFWKRALYPLSCFVMIGLALPFAYLPIRSGGTSWKVFVGILLGVSFVLLTNVFRHVGLLGNWTPWVVAAVPGIVYLLLSLAAFSWFVRYR